MSLRPGRGRTADEERGSAAIELAFLVPVLALITFGVIDFARLFSAYMTVASAAHESANFLAQNSTVTDTDLQTVAAAESPSALGNFLTFTGASPNASLLRVTSLASGTVNTTPPLFVRVQVTYNFQPLVKFPLKGPITVQAVADAPKSRALT